MVTVTTEDGDGTTVRPSTDHLHGVGVRPPAILFIGESAPFRAARERIRRIAKTDATVLIEGETGTGKDLAARVVHYEGRRCSGPFIPLNCGAIPESLLESELFGYQQGAFTDAKKSSPGVLLLADGGTLFLDEVDSLPHRAQVALLRFLQDRTIRPLGSGAERKLDVRIIAASNRSLAELVLQRAFRQDLYYRLNVMHVELPPLRARGDDIELYAMHFLRQFAAQHDIVPPALDGRSLEWLQSHSWPGNIRELENLIEREFLLSEGEPVLHMSFLGRAERRQGGSEERWNYQRAKAHVLEDFNRRFLQQLMRFSRGNIALAARTSGKERRDLGRLLRRYAITPEAYRGE